jgi:hypothetical protein
LLGELATILRSVYVAYAAIAGVHLGWEALRGYPRFQALVKIVDEKRPPEATGLPTHI